jgi:hypothetical protein
MRFVRFADLNLVDLPVSRRAEERLQTVNFRLGEEQGKGRKETGNDVDDYPVSLWSRERVGVEGDLSH